MNTTVPLTAYPCLSLRRWWITITTPAGHDVRLFTSYDSRADAERAIETYGFILRLRPVHTMITRGHHHNDG